jgi:hypothetical protein
MLRFESVSWAFSFQERGGRGGLFVKTGLVQTDSWRRKIVSARESDGTRALESESQACHNASDLGLGRLAGIFIIDN